MEPVTSVCRSRALRPKGIWGDVVKLQPQSEGLGLGVTK